MVLSRYLITIEVPDDFLTQRQERALETLDSIDLPARAEAWLQAVLAETRNLTEARAHVSL